MGGYPMLPLRQEYRTKSDVVRRMCVVDDDVRTLYTIGAALMDNFELCKRSELFLAGDGYRYVYGGQVP